MRSLGALAAVLVLACACAGGPAVGGPGKSGAVASDARLPTLSPPPGAKGGSPSPIAGVVDPSAKCVRQFTGSAMVLIGQALYDVTDPVHPSLVCLIRNTSVQLFTADTFEYVRRSGPDGTEVVLHSIGSGNESVVAGWPLKLLDDSGRAMGTWTPDGNSAATIVPGTDAAGNQTLQVWLFAQAKKTELYEFPLPLTDCICRFGLPTPTIAFSADGQYLVSGWPVGKGAQPLRIYRVADATLMATLDITDVTPLWSTTGHVLLLGANRYWTVENGVGGKASVIWSYMAGWSPSGSQIAYTAYADAVSIRVYVFDFNTGLRMLIDASRSEVTFVKDGWVWYWGELPCGDCPGGSAATGPVYAMQVGSGNETPVVFAPGESPVALQSSWGPGKFWPNS